MNKKIANGLSWSFFEKILTEAIVFIITVVLSRILLPDDYGVISLISIFITIFQVFIGSGLGSALIQKKNPSDADYSTALTVNFCMGAMLYLILFFAAPYIAAFFENEQVCPVLRVIALQIPISSIYNIQTAHIQKSMQFKKLFFASLGGTVASGVVGIAMAYMGFGVWALVMSTLGNLVVDAIVLAIASRWFPKPGFSKRSFKGLSSFGWKILVADLINKLYDQLRSVFIGKKYTGADLAYNSKAQKLPVQLIDAVNSTMIRVMFPAMSEVQDEREKLRKMSKWLIKMISFCLYPLMVGMAVTAPVFIPLVFTENWVGCVPYMQIYCVTYLVQPMQSVNIKSIQAMGRSDITLKLEVIKKIFGVVTIVLSIVLFNSPLAVAASYLVVTFFSTIVNVIPCKKLCGYGFLDEIRDMLPSMLLSFAMGIVVFLIGLINMDLLPKLALQVLSGGIIYIGLAKLFKVKELDAILSFIKEKKNAGRK